jgi:hypothetical protein
MSNHTTSSAIGNRRSIIVSVGTAFEHSAAAPIRPQLGKPSRPKHARSREPRSRLAHAGRPVAAAAGSQGAQPPEASPGGDSDGGSSEGGAGADGADGADEDEPRPTTLASSLRMRRPPVCEMCRRSMWWHGSTYGWACPGSDFEGCRSAFYRPKERPSRPWRYEERYPEHAEEATPNTKKPGGDRALPYRNEL